MNKEAMVAYFAFYMQDKLCQHARYLCWRASYQSLKRPGFYIDKMTH